MSNSASSASEHMLNILRECRLLLAVTLHGPDDWQGLGELLEQSSICGVEIMLRSEFAWDGIERLRQKWPSLVIGVGTVLSQDDLVRAQTVGADFAVSPGTRADLLDLATSRNFPYLPGAMNASDLMLIFAMGWRAVKFFPGAPLGPSFLQALAAPFPDLRFCVSGGLEVGNYRQFLKVRQVAGLSGSWPLPRNLSDADAREAMRPMLLDLAEELRMALATENPQTPYGARP